jgi:hypothetical protein
VPSSSPCATGRSSLNNDRHGDGARLLTSASVSRLRFGAYYTRLRQLPALDGRCTDLGYRGDARRPDHTYI